MARQIALVYEYAYILQGGGAGFRVRSCTRHYLSFIRNKHIVLLGGFVRSRSPEMCFKQDDGLKKNSSWWKSSEPWLKNAKAIIILRNFALYSTTSEAYVAHWTRGHALTLWVLFQLAQQSFAMHFSLSTKRWCKVIVSDIKSYLSRLAIGVSLTFSGIVDVLLFIICSFLRSPFWRLQSLALCSCLVG